MCFKFVVFVCVVSSLINNSFAKDSSSNTTSKKTDLVQDNLNWECANNASCVRAVSFEVINRLKYRKPIKIGEISVEPMGTEPFTGRSIGALDFLSGNAVKIPLGPIMLSVQRSIDYDNYIEVALLKKSTDEGRSDGSGIGGGGGGIGGGGGGGGGGGNRRKDRKHFQMFIPMFLAFNAAGWMALAIKSVAVLTLKALFVSKLAFVVTAAIVIKKLMDSATEKMMASHHFDHPEPIMMPYNMEYALPSHSYHAADLGANDLYSLHMAGGHDAGGSAHGLEGMTAESTLNHMVNLHNATQQAQNIIGLQTVAKVKRQDRDMWTGFRRKPIFYNYLAAAKNPVPVQVYRK